MPLNIVVKERNLFFLVEEVPQIRAQPRNQEHSIEYIKIKLIEFQRMINADVATGMAKWLECDRNTLGHDEFTVIGSMHCIVQKLCTIRRLRYAVFH